MFTQILGITVVWLRIGNSASVAGELFVKQTKVEANEESEPLNHRRVAMPKS